VISRRSWSIDLADCAFQEFGKVKQNQTDFENSCRTFLHDILLLGKGDSLLIYIDKAPDEVVAGDIQAYAQSMGIETEILQLQCFSGLTEMIDALCEKITAGNYDAVCELSSRYFYPTRVWGQAVQKGCRLYSVGAMDASAFIRCIGNVNHEKLAEFGMELYRQVVKGRRVRLESEAGTRISFKMNTSSLTGRILSKMKLTAMSQVGLPTGTLGQTGSATFLGGQLSLHGIPDTIEGTAVIDGFMWPPDEVGHIDEPIVLEIKRGQVVRISGNPAKSGVLNEWLKGREKGIEHFCIGFNPGARISSNIVEAERAYGHITVGLGKYPYHTDGVITNPKLIVNGSILMENNSFTNEKLSALANNLHRVDKP
jgi:2,5-dihydroxypyridine 5,6-dioxygenase